MVCVGDEEHAEHAKHVERLEHVEHVEQNTICCQTLYYQQVSSIPAIQVECSLVQKLLNSAQYLHRSAHDKYIWNLRRFNDKLGYVNLLRANYEAVFDQRYQDRPAAHPVTDGGGDGLYVSAFDQAARRRWARGVGVYLGRGVDAAQS